MGVTEHVGVTSLPPSSIRNKDWKHLETRDLGTPRHAFGQRPLILLGLGLQVECLHSTVLM